jgi:hypothetical protein
MKKSLSQRWMFWGAPLGAGVLAGAAIMLAIAVNASCGQNQAIAYPCDSCVDAGDVDSGDAEANHDGQTYDSECGCYEYSTEGVQQ